MMKSGFKLFVSGLFLLLALESVPAQEIPLLPRDKAVSQGVLPNGMTYYIVTNGTRKGLADFALVRKDGAVKKYEDVMISVSESLLDSTLLSVMKTADKSSPADQAVVVAGDVDAAAVAGKIRMLSYMSPVRDTAAREAYGWKPSEGLRVVTSSRPDVRLATITMTWDSQRTSWAMMPTIQPAISSLFVGQMGIVARERIARCLRQAGIPFADVSYVHNGSNATAGNERFSISVTTAPEQLEQTVKIMSYVMSSIDSGSATVQEVNRAHYEYLRTIGGPLTSPFLSNREYVSRCAASFLYNGSLASGKDIYTFHASRQLDDKVELDLFNGIAGALLDKENNVTVECVSVEAPDSSRIAGLFSSAWDMQSSLQWKDMPEASSLLKVPSPEKKMKIVSTRTDPMSGGSVNTLENGITVICRNVPADNRIFYSLAINGGYADIAGLKEGEGAYAVDYLTSCKVAGVSFMNFRNALAADGIVMDVNVGLSSTVISGSASKFDVAKVLQALTTFTETREQDAEAFAYRLKGASLLAEAMKGTVMGRKAAVDRLMCPDNGYSAYRSENVPGEDFAARAEKFFSAQFGRINDGVLVLTGDVNETELKKELAIYAPSFRTTQRNVSRPVFRYQPVSGLSTETVAGSRNSLDVAVSARLSLTLDNYLAARVAAGVIRSVVTDVFADTGWTATVTEDFAVNPDERFNVLVSFSEDAPSGFESGDFEPMDRMEVAALFRSVMSSLAESTPDQGLVNAWRDNIKNRMTLNESNPTYWLRSISGRALSGKDLYSGYGARCDAVNVQKVKEILSSLYEGGKVEYFVTKE